MLHETLHFPQSFAVLHIGDNELSSPVRRLLTTSLGAVYLVVNATRGMSLLSGCGCGCGPPSAKVVCSLNTSNLVSCATHFIMSSGSGIIRDGRLERVKVTSSSSWSKLKVCLVFCEMHNHSDHVTPNLYLA